MLRERAFVTEGGCFTAGVTFSHVSDPFSTMIPMLAQTVRLAHRVEGQSLFSKARDFTIQRNLIQDKMLK